MAKLKYNFQTGKITSSKEKLEETTRTIGETIEIYQNQQIDEIAKSKIAYYVQVHNPEKMKEGALQFGTSNIAPGDVNGEFIMTKGHFHEISNRAEYYFGIQGKGLLLLMDKDFNCTYEEISESSLHYIPADTAHRLVNIGEEKLVVGACWNADAGHDYDLIAKEGFKIRVFKANNQQGYEIINVSRGEK